jgi:methionine salvage enolase-phosphatase E1
MFPYVNDFCKHIKTVGSSVADALIEILKDNLAGCEKTEERFVVYIAKLVTEKRDARLLRLLQTLVVAKGEAIKSKQNMVLKHLTGLKLVSKETLQIFGISPTTKM